MRKNLFLALAVAVSVISMGLPAYAQWPKIMPPSGTEPMPDGPEIGNGPPELWWLVTTPPNGFFIYRPNGTPTVYFAHIFKKGTVVRRVVRNYPDKEQFLTAGPDSETYRTTVSVFLVFRLDVPRDDQGLYRPPTKDDLRRWYDASDYMVTVADESPPRVWFFNGEDETKYLKELQEVLLPALLKSQEAPPESPSPKSSPAPGPRRARSHYLITL